MTAPKLTDEGIADLDISAGRAELLEEILALEVVETRRQVPRWLPALGAAAAVAALVVGPLLLRGDEPVAVDAPIATAPAAESIVILDAKGWTLGHVGVDEDRGGTLSYSHGGRSVEINWRLADLYDHYIRDRRDSATGEKVTLLGGPATLWAYSPRDHAVIPEQRGDYMIEIRGDGMPRQVFLHLLGRLVTIDPADLEAHLPEEFVTTAERPAVIASMLDGIPLPEGFDPAIESDEVDEYALGAEVVSRVTCAWLRHYDSDDPAASDEAAEALIGARDWPVLDRLDELGGEYSGGIREISDRLTAGRTLEGVDAEAFDCNQ